MNLFVINGEEREIEELYASNVELGYLQPNNFWRFFILFPLKVSARRTGLNREFFPLISTLQKIYFGSELVVVVYMQTSVFLWKRMYGDG